MSAEALRARINRAKEPEETLAEAVARLARLPPLDYDRARQAEADKLGVRVTTLDREVEKARPVEATSDEDLFGWTVDPWPEPVDGAALLNELAWRASKHVVLPDHAADTIALWITHSWTHDSASISPVLAVESATKRSGKTTLLTYLGFVVARPLPSANVTAPVVFRSVEKWRPCLLVDEADTFLSDNDELRGVLNSGHNRTTAKVLRTVGDEHEPMVFSTWSPKVIALIGELPDTLRDRALVVVLKRKLPGEQVQPLRVDAGDSFLPLRRQLARWSADRLPDLRNFEPAIPAGLNDRAADNWRHLIAIADLAGGNWPERARKAALAISGGADDDGSVACILLADIRDVFTAVATDRLSSADLVARLVEREDRPWVEWRGGKPMTVRQLARQLDPFSIAPGTIRVGNATPKGYRLKQFEDAFSRYLGGSEPQHRHKPQESGSFEHNSSATLEPDVADENPLNLAATAACGGVADSKGVSRPAQAPTPDLEAWEGSLK